jgi:elongation factor Ts
MTQIDARLVEALREKTGAGVIACKHALEETHGDFEAAADRLRAAELLKAAQRADRVAAEGLVGVVVEGTMGAIAELNTETDFVARTDAFQQTAAAIARIALRARGDLHSVLGAPAPDGDGSVADLIARLTARTGERINLRRCACVSVGEGLVEPYIHNIGAPGLGRIGVLVALESSADPNGLHDVGHKIAMHVAASSPLWVSQADVPADVVAGRRAELTDQARQTGKPPAIVEKMVEGRMRKFYEEVVLGQQPFVLSPDQRVEQALEEAARAAGAPIAITAFVRFQTGEGIDKRPEGTSLSDRRTTETTEFTETNTRS